MSVLQEQYVVDSKGKKIAVVLSLKRYEQLLEDLHDWAAVAERRDEKAVSMVSMTEMMRRLKRVGLL
jgi:PHD/YefM family antitoxin component YafN of YafNO toxin-antitoxin module